MTMANRTTVPEPSASSESFDPVLTALYDNNISPRIDTPLEFNRPVSLMRAFISRHPGDRE